MKKQQVAIISDGAAGLAVAVSTVKYDARVMVVEHMDRVGKKILSTGNGRRNITSLYMGPECYRSNDRSFPMKVIQGFPIKETLGFFRNLGIEPKDRSKYIYPNSDQASMVLGVLHQEVDHLGARMLLPCEVRGIESVDHTYQINTNQGVLEADALILITNSRAVSAIGSDGSGYEPVKKLGYNMIKPLPALVQPRRQGAIYRQMAGVRTRAKVSLFSDEKLLAEDRGELQLTDYGLSGIPIFRIDQLTSRALDQGREVIVKVDFMSSWKDGDVFGPLKKQTAYMRYETIKEVSVGLLSRKLALVPIRLASIDPCRKASGLSPGQLRHLVQQLKSYEAIIMSVSPFASAQIYCGGADIEEVNVLTVKSRVRKDLYLAGELLDMGGICDGYNLQFT